MVHDHERIRRFVRELQSQSERLAAGLAGTDAEAGALVRETLREIEEAVEELQVTEEELRASNESLETTQAQLEMERLRYVDLFHSAPDGYIVAGRDGVIREANRAAAALLGAHSSRLPGKPLALYVEEGDRRRFRRYLLRAAEGEVGNELDVYLSPRHGQPVPVAIRMAAVVGRGGEVTELRCTLRDLTERKRSEEQARQLEAERVARREAERANQVKADFLSTVSHELRTPLTTIMAYAELLAMGIPVPLPEEAAKPVHYIDEAARHLLLLIEQILGFARVEAGREEVQRETVEVGELLREVAVFVGPLATKRGLRMEIGGGADGLEIVTDRAKLRQILINLTSNAVKFTQEGEVRLDGEVRDRSLFLHVQDTGVGIAGADLEKVFDPFWQAQQGPTRQAGGTGLGLAICRRLADLLDGELEATSIPGVGSCFSVRLPLVAA